MRANHKEVENDQMISGPTLFQADLQSRIRRQIITSQEKKHNHKSKTGFCSTCLNLMFLEFEDNFQMKD